MNGDQDDPEKEPETDDGSRRTGLSGAWIAIGAGVGAAVGVATDNIGVGIAIGVAVGAAIMAGQNASARKK